jgi:hypothetical protein
MKRPVLITILILLMLSSAPASSHKQKPAHAPLAHSGQQR